MKAGDLQIRGLRPGDLEVLGSFTCSTGEPWEDVVEQQIRGPLPLRYLQTPPYFDGRMLLGIGPAGDLLVVGAHHIEPSMVPDVGYTEVIAVARDARGVLVDLPEGEQLSLGHFMLLVIFQQMRRLGRHPRTFVRVDRRNTRSLALLDRVALSEERDDASAELVQRWGELSLL
ncbi:hypothetical protein DSM104299_04422 [Baekduia alba]|uniref:hypothetical protein n=1 Tax=Baekduia alba TaxID=2997333 RepID=UPI002340CDE4|nr:hypothetical protein [Baekduia alba]WCB95673.1 hypothetical protein DSM104299_04422 [Baekduia alba]